MSSSARVCCFSLHPKSGLAWSYGRDVYKTPISAVSDVLQKEETPTPIFSCKRGVTDLAFNKYLSNECYLLVCTKVELNILSIKEVKDPVLGGPAGDAQGTGSENGTAKVTLIKEFNIGIVHRGLLWNPLGNVFAAVTDTLCYVYHHRELAGAATLRRSPGDKRFVGFSKVHECPKDVKLLCGGWLRRGSKLVLGEYRGFQVVSWSSTIKDKQRRATSVQEMLEYCKVEVVKRTDIMSLLAESSGGLEAGGPPQQIEPLETFGEVDAFAFTTRSGVVYVAQVSADNQVDIMHFCAPLSNPRESGVGQMCSLSVQPVTFVLTDTSGSEMQVLIYEHEQVRHLKKIVTEDEEEVVGLLPANGDPLDGEASVNVVTRIRANSHYYFYMKKTNMLSGSQLKHVSMGKVRRASREERE